MKAKEIVLLIFIILAGVVLYHFQTGQINWDWDEEFIFIGDEYTYKDIQQIAPPLPAELHVFNSHGRVEVIGSDRENIEIELEKQIWNRKQKRADEVNDALKIGVSTEEDRIQITVNEEDLNRRRFRTNFKIYIPRNMPVNIKNSYGEVRVEAVGESQIVNRNGNVIAIDIAGRLYVNNSYNDVDLTNVSADCEVDSHHSTVEANNIKGSLKVTHRYGRISAFQITGTTSIEGSHTEFIGHELTGETNVNSSYRRIFLYDVGDVTLTGNSCPVEIEGTRGDVNITDKYSHVKLLNLSGNLIIDGKNLGITGKSIVGDLINIRSSYRDLELLDFSGQTTIWLDNGDMTLTPLPLTHPIEAKGDFTDITFYWPEGNTYPIEAHARRGDIYWKLDEELDYEEENGMSVIKAFSSEIGKPKIVLNSKDGKITIQKLLEKTPKF
ncbi:hypothetical protein ACFLT9_02855 [Acidobacteriota bacterium]